MSLVNVADSGGTLTKVGGCSGCPDASAVSNQQISGTGTLQFSTDDRSTLRFVGLAGSGVGTTPSDVSFAVRLQSGVAEVRENGAYRTEIAFNAGDTFTISVTNGTVTYLKNGGLFYTSGSPASAALRGHAIFFDSNGSVRNVAFGGGGAAPSAVAPAAVTDPAPTTPTAAAGTAVARPAGSKPVRRKPRSF